jgi:3-hydroxy-9,10-secoandrosta-1,3,5(10)-triene-9,17-dione monooxygenase reductase component
LASYPAFIGATLFAVHVLREGQAERSTRFATRGADKFADLPRRGSLGWVPILSGGLVVFHCRRTSTYDGGDHSILLGGVVWL